jgi:hypothetical protein
MHDQRGVEECPGTKKEEIIISTNNSRLSNDERGKSKRMAWPFSEQYQSHSAQDGHR